MHFVTFVIQTFFEIGESLVVACESNDNIEAQAMFNKGAVACGVFNNVQGHICLMHDEEFVEEKCLGSSS